MLSSKMKLEIELFDGSNWPTWKYRVLLLLRSNTGTLEAVQGTLVKPAHPGEGAEAEALTKYKVECDSYNKIESTALLLLTTNMTNEMLNKVMRFTTASDMWDELNRLYERGSQDRTYDLCMQLFNYKKDPSHDMGSHMSAIKNIWHDLNQALSTVCNQLPEILLICKILDSLPEEYFSFKSSWLLITLKDRTIENLTTQLCAHERALKDKNKSEAEGESSTEVLIVHNRKQDHKKRFKCNYCGASGHRVKQCKKWITDGRPPKPPKESTSNAATLSSLALSLGESNDKDSWYVDNGATSHVTNRGDQYVSFEYFSESHRVMTANGENIEAIGKGSIQVKADINGQNETITLTNVWFVPCIQRKLFSVLAAQDLCENSSFESSTRSCLLKVDGKTKLVGTRDKYGGLYKLKIQVIKPKVEINQLSVTNQLQLYHERLGHQNKRHVKRVMQREFAMQFKSENNKEVCEGCVYGKTHRRTFGTRERTTRLGELIHTDVCGPFVYSISKYRYFVLFKDNFTRFRYVYFLRQKSEVQARLKDFLAEAKTSGHVIQELLSDNGGEFDNEQVRSTLRKFGIKQRLTMPYTPEQNGSAERDNRTIVEMARALMHAHDEIPKGLWAEVVQASVYILNRTGPTPNDGKSPYELWYNKKPKINHLRIIGCVCYVHVPKQKRSKLDKKAQKGILIGYDGDDGYRVYDTRNFKLLRSRDVTFEEVPLLDRDIPGIEDLKPEIKKNTYEISTSSIDDQPNLEIPTRLDQSDDHLHSVNLDNGIGDSNEGKRHEEDTWYETGDSNEEERQEEDTQTVEGNRRVLRDRSQIKPPDRFNFEQFINQVIAVPEPSSYREAMKSTEKDKWVEAMNSEINSLKENETWKLTQLPNNRKALNCKWVFKVKKNPDGSIDKFKARLVAVGYSQKKGIDYYKTFSPVAKLSTIRVLLSIAANEGLSLKQFDVSTAFLYGKVKEEIYMRQPEGYNDGSGKVCKLIRSLYGLKQAPKCWNECIHDFFIESGFIQSEADPCLYVRQRGKTKILLALYVDDGLLVSSDDVEADNFIENELKVRFKITTKPPSYFLGLELERHNDGSIRVHQAAYTKKVLEKYGMSDCKAVGTPIVKDIPVKKLVEEICDIKFPYRQAVGALAYLMVGTRPDIAYAVGVVSRTLDNPTNTNVLQVKRIFRYLKGTVETGLEFKKNEKRLMCYSDADHGGDNLSGCSTSGLICMFAGSAISWRSVKQTSVALSSTEAEIVAASEACREMIWLKRLFKNLSDKLETPVLRIDNESAIKLAHNPPYEYHRKTKHIKLRHFYVRQCVSEGDIQIEQVPTQEQLADIFTKPLFQPRLVKLCEDFGLKKKREC